MLLSSIVIIQCTYIYYIFLFIPSIVDCSFMHETSEMQYIKKIKFLVSFNREKYSYTYLSPDMNGRICSYLLHDGFNKLSRWIFQKDLSNSGQARSIFNDPGLVEQWFFRRNVYLTSTLSHDLDILWSRNITGKGVHIGVIGFNVQYNHKDLKDNYNPQNSFNFLTKGKYVYPINVGRATPLVGLMSAVANNKICGVGAAPSSKFSCLQVLSDTQKIIQDSTIAKSFTHLYNTISIYLFTLEFDRKTEIMDTIGSSSISELVKGRMFGRNGLGSIYLKSSGSLKHEGNNCAFRGHNQRPEFLIIGSINILGQTPDYAENCTAILTAALSSYTYFEMGLFYSTVASNKCEKAITGTGAASSIAAGIIALILEYSPHLTARQIMILIIHSSKQYDRDSIRNTAGFLYSYYHGFGMMNATEMIIYSRDPVLLNLPAEHICYTPFFMKAYNIEPNKFKRIYIYTSGCLDYPYCVTIIEQLYFTFSLDVHWRKDVTMYLTSPKGTSFEILTPRIFDFSSRGFRRWTLKILGFYGEPVRGVWKLDVYADQHEVVFRECQMKIYGTCINPKDNRKLHARVRSYADHSSFSDNCPLFQDYYHPQDIDSNGTQGFDVVSVSGDSAKCLTKFNYDI